MVSVLLEKVFKSKIYKPNGEPLTKPMKNQISSKPSKTSIKNGETKSKMNGFPKSSTMLWEKSDGTIYKTPTELIKTVFPSSKSTSPKS